MGRALVLFAGLPRRKEQLAWSWCCSSQGPFRRPFPKHYSAGGEAHRQGLGGRQGGERRQQINCRSHKVRRQDDQRATSKVALLIAVAQSEGGGPKTHQMVAFQVRLGGLPGPSLSNCLHQ